jgi:hypothetical protein
MPRVPTQVGVAYDRHRGQRQRPERSIGHATIGITLDGFENLMPASDG